MKNVTVPVLVQRKGGKKIVMVTCYDYTTARLLQKAGVDSILVGDSLGMVIKGEGNTLSVTVDEVAYHVSCVKRGASGPFLIADMPFGSYQSSVEEGVRNAVKLMRAGANAVKVEGGGPVVSLVRKLTDHGIPVVGHLGMTPQHVHSFGGFAMRGKTDSEQSRIREDAAALNDAGMCMLVIESVPGDLAADLTAAVSVPTVGIGAGPDTDGQVLVLQDLLGMNESFVPPFVKQYLRLYEDIPRAIGQFGNDVRSGDFPERK